jgi:hypothetical protein
VEILPRELTARASLRGLRMRQLSDRFTGTDSTPVMKKARYWRGDSNTEPLPTPW